MDELKKIVAKLSSSVGMRKRILKKSLSLPIPCSLDDKDRYFFALGSRHVMRDYLESMQVFENIVCELKNFIKENEKK